MILTTSKMSYDDIDAYANVCVKYSQRMVLFAKNPLNFGNITKNTLTSKILVRQDGLESRCQLKWNLPLSYKNPTHFHFRKPILFWYDF